VLAAGFAATTFLALGTRAEPAKAETRSTIGGGAVARVPPPAEKIKVLEDELAKEVERRGKAEEDNARRLTENNELVASAKILAKESASLEARLAETRDRETKVQRANDRLREENERIVVTVRLALPIVAVVCTLILAMLVWLFLFLRQVATRVHGQRTLAEMHALEARLNHANDQYNAELKRNQTLRNKLAELGIVDEQSPHTPTGQWRAR
jgi:Fe2+ transport system protein B